MVRFVLSQNGLSQNGLSQNGDPWHTAKVQGRKSPRLEKIQGSRRGPQGQSAGQWWSTEGLSEDITEIECLPVNIGSVSQREGKEAGCHSAGCRGDVSGRGTRPQDMRGIAGPNGHGSERASGRFGLPPSSTGHRAVKPNLYFNSNSRHSECLKNLKLQFLNSILF